MQVKAPAKLNLHLEVVKKREDGFHDLKTVFQLIDLYDDLDFKLNQNSIQLKETTKKIKDNIVLKAAFLLKEKTCTNRGVTISLNKSIPIQKGLGGGSSDAAATLIALNHLWSTQLSKNELLDLSLDLGSDVPFFIHGQATWAEGRGEVFTDIDLKHEWYLLIFPKTSISTAEAFNEISISKKEDITLQEYLSGKSINTFLNWSKNKYPEIKRIFSSMKRVGVPKLSGTGSTLFVSFSNKMDADKALKEFPNGILVKSLDHSPLRQLIE